MKGKESQPLVAQMARNEVKAPSNQDTAEIPKIYKTWLTTPNCWWNMPFQINAVM